MTDLDEGDLYKQHLLSNKSILFIIKYCLNQNVLFANL